MILVDSGSFWGFHNEFFELETVFLGFCGFLKLITGSTGIRNRDLQRESDIVPLHYVHYDQVSEVKPGQTHVLLGWAATWDKTSILRFPAPGGRPKRGERGEKFGADGFFPQKCP